MNIAPERYIVNLLERSFIHVRGKNVSINNLLSGMGIDDFNSILEENGLHGHDLINDKNLYKVKWVLIHNINAILSRNKDQIEAAKRYYGEILEGHKNVLIVDVGWGGSSAAILRYFIENNISPEYRIHGSLLFSNDSEGIFPSLSSDMMSVYISSPIKNLDLSRAQFTNDKNIAHRNNQMLEYLFTSVEGSLIKYDLDEEKNVLLVKSRRTCGNAKEIEDMHEGMIDFAEEYERSTERVRRMFSISPYVAYAPFLKMLQSERYFFRIYQNFTYDAAIFEGKEIDAVTFGEKYQKKDAAKKKKILLISHSFSHTGAPHSLLRIGKVLLELGYYCEVWSPHSGGMEPDYMENGIPVKIVKPNMLYDRDTIREMKKFDFAIANTILTYEYYSAVRKYMPAIWYIREATNIPEYCNKKYNYKMYSALRRAKDIYCVSEYAAEHIKKYNRNVEVIHNCVEDYSKYSKPERHSKVRFIQLGSIEPRKGYHVLIDAFGSLDRYYKERCELFFAGQKMQKSGDYYDTIMEKVSKMDNVHYLGEIRDDVEKTRIISSTDAVIVASLDESCSLVALEATMLSKPLIVTENVGAKYMVTEENGIIVKTNDADSLKNAIVSIIDNKDRLPEMGGASRRMYDEYASMERHRSDIGSMVLRYLEGSRKDKRSKRLGYRIFSENVIIDLFRNAVTTGQMLINSDMDTALGYLKNGTTTPRKIVPPIEKIYRRRSGNKIHKKTKLSKNDEMIVSLTSHPPRMPTIHLGIESILRQHLRPTKVILYLAEWQFPNKEGDLPDSLLCLLKKGLTIKWCEDLKLHNKYYHAMMEHPDSIVVTMDDDILYDPYTLTKLYNSYKKNPDSISCMRVHRITFDEKGSIKKYRDWKWEDDSLLGIKSYQALLTGVGGVLYPPGSLHEEVFNKESIKALCLKTDDLWLKIMSLAKGTTVVLADRHRRLKDVHGTLESGTAYKNVPTDNDICLRNILEKYNGIRKDKKLTDILKDDSL